VSSSSCESIQIIGINGGGDAGNAVIALCSGGPRSLLFIVASVASLNMVMVSTAAHDNNVPKLFRILGNLEQNYCSTNFFVAVPLT
jgi:hypothetical protein